MIQKWGWNKDFSKKNWENSLSLTLFYKKMLKNDLKATESDTKEKCGSSQKNGEQQQKKR